MFFQIMVVPRGFTGHHQPLDRLFFRQWKAISKKISDYVTNRGLSVHIFNRENILKLQSLIHNQFSHPRFVTFIQKSWISAGLIEENDMDIVNPANYCMKNLSTCQLCAIEAVIRCSHCENELCFTHFFENFHTHFD